MPFYKLTYSPQYRRATVYNYGCNFRCRGCAYKLKGYPQPERIPPLDEFKARLGELDIERLHFMGGEPTTNPDLPEMLRFGHEQLGVVTVLGHTNGSCLPADHLDATNVSFKAFNPEKHLDYTGHPAEPVYRNFRTAFERGLEVRASTVFIPGYTDLDELVAIVDFIASLSHEIPFHVMGYIPVPGAPWERPTEAQMAAALALARSRLTTVGSSHLTPQQARDLGARDDRFNVIQVI